MSAAEPAAEPTRADVWREVVAVLVAVFAVVTAAAAARRDAGWLAATVESWLAYALLALVAVAAVRLRRRPVAASLGLDRDRPGRQALVGLAVAAALTAVVLGVPVALGAAVTDVTGAADPSVGRLVASVAKVVLVVGPVEELVFRGYLLGRLRDVVRPGWALVLSSVAFGLWHFPGGQDVLQVVTTTAIGLGLGAVRLRVRGGTVAALALGHGLYDAGLAVAAWLAS